MKKALLVAGPMALDDLPDHPGLIGGGGAYAALAAAALAPTQVWARAGTGYDERLRGIFTQRRIDLGGVSWTGETPRFRDGRFTAGGPLLGDLVPTTAEHVGAVLLIDLDAAELAVAIAAVQALPGHETRPLLIALRQGCDAALEERAAAAADVVILAAQDNALARTQVLQGLGAKCICWCMGPFGGLVAYQQKTTTWPALPLEVVEGTGITASFAGTLAAQCALQGKADFAAIKRGLALASAVASITAQGPGPKKLLASDAKTYEERFNRLRRTHKF